MKSAIVGALAAALICSSADASPKNVYRKAGPAVVLILGSDGGAAGSAGTGSIVTSEGKVITNAHVVINHAGKPFKILYVFLKPPKITGDNGKDLSNRFKARVLGFSSADELDLALIQIENPPPRLPTISFADPGEVEIGDEVIAIGHPENGGLWTLTTGAISTMIANFGRVKGKHVFQTSASVNRGNSGGPLLDMDGNMVAINTAIARQGAGGVAITGVNFSLKSSVAVTWLAGQGMGLAYATGVEKEPVAVALAPDTSKPAAADASGAAQTKAPAPTEAPVVAKAPPPSTIVVAEKPPKNVAEVAELKKQGETIGKAKEPEKVEAGKKLDPAKAKPKFITKRRKISLADIRRQQMKELEDMMEDMRGKIKQKKKGRGNGMGLW